LPRNRRFKSRIAASLVTSTVTCPRNRTAACARVKNCANVRTEGNWSGATGDFRPGAAAGGPAEGFAETGFGGESDFSSGSMRIIVRGAGYAAQPHRDFDFT
jgi:hypothetical protein